MEATLSSARLDTQSGGEIYNHRLAAVSTASPSVQQFLGLVRVTGSKLRDCFPEDFRQYSPELAWWEALGNFVGSRAQHLPPAWSENDDGSRVYHHMRMINHVVSECANLCLELHSTENEPFISMERTQINIFKGQFGYLNVGDIQNVESISVNLSNLVQNNHKGLATALESITKAIDEEESLTNEQKSEALEQVSELARQATLEPASRTSKGVVKAVAQGLGSVLSAAGGTATVWSTWGPEIAKFFGF